MVCAHLIVLQVALTGRVGLIKTQVEPVLLDRLFVGGGLGRWADQPHYVAISSRGQTCITIEKHNGVIATEDPSFETPVARMPVFDFTPVTAVYSPDGALLAVASRTILQVVHMDTGAWQVIPGLVGIVGLAWSSNRLFVAQRDCIVEFERVGVRSLRDLCAFAVRMQCDRNPGMDVSWLPPELQGLLAPPQGNAWRPHEPSPESSSSPELPQARPFFARWWDGE